MNLEQLLMKTNTIPLLTAEKWKGEMVEETPYFNIEVHKHIKDKIYITIHTDGVEGPTLDFFVKGNTLTPIQRRSN